MRSEEIEGLEPKTNRDYLVLMWDSQKTILKRLEDLNGWRENTEDRVDRIEERQSVLAGIQAAFTVFAAGLAGYLGVRK